MKRLILAIIVTSLASSATAQEPSEVRAALLGGIDTVFLGQFSDSVRDGCLPTPSRVSDSIELAVRSAGQPIVDRWVSRNTLIIEPNAVGYASKTVGGAETGCVVVLQLKFQVYLDVFGEIWEYTLKDAVQLLAGDKASMQRRLASTAREETDRLMLEILREQQAVAEGS